MNKRKEAHRKQTFHIITSVARQKKVYIRQELDQLQSSASGKDAWTTLYIRSAPQKMAPLESQRGSAVRRDEGVTPRTEQRAQDPLFCQGSLPGCPQRFTQHLKLPTPAATAPWHHREYAIYPLHPVLHLLWPRLWMSQFLHQELNECVLQSVRIRTWLVLDTEQKNRSIQRYNQRRDKDISLPY